MSQKKLKVIRRVVALFLAIFFALSVGFFSKKLFAVNPTIGNDKVFTFTDGLSRSWGNVSLAEGTAVDDGTGSNQKIFFGCDPETHQPYTWWIAGRTHSTGEISSDPAHSSHMILYSTKDIQATQFTTATKTLSLSDLSADQKSEFSGLKLSAFPMNHYGVSTARKSLRDCASHILSADEKKLLRESEIRTMDTTNHTSYTTSDKFYLPSGNQALGVISFGSDDISAKTALTPQEIQKLIPKKYLSVGHDDANIFWTRSAVADNPNQQYTFSSGKEVAVKNFPAIYGFSCSALCKVNLETVYFAAAASAFHTRSNFENQGKVTPLATGNIDYGMYLKTIPAGTGMSDAVIKAKPGTSIFTFENAPKDAYMSACLVDAANANLSYTVSVPVNPDGKTPNGQVDVSKLDTSAVGKGKKLNVIVWLEMGNKDNIVASYPQTTCFTTNDDITIGKIESKSYTSKKIEPDLVVKCADKPLELKKDYTVTYLNNTAVGTASVIVKGLGAYADKVAFATFDITKNVPKLELENKKVVYSGEAVKIDPPKISNMPNADKFDMDEVTYVYYKDAECTKRICSFTEKDKKTAKLPHDPGTYYVKATIAETDTYTKAESNVARIDIVAG